MEMSTSSVVRKCVGNFIFASSIASEALKREIDRYEPVRYRIVLAFRRAL